MYSTRLRVFFYFFLLSETSGDSRLIVAPRNYYPRASTVVASISRALCSEYSRQEQTTFVFVLFATPEHRILFKFLWELPHAHVYLADQHFPLKRNDREIVISWERDKKPFGDGVNKYWGLSKECGHSDCSEAEKNLQFLHLEKRALIQVREIESRDLNEAARIPKILSQQMIMKYYLQRYRSSFIILRPVNADVAFTAYTVKRSNRVIGEQVVKTYVKSFEMDDARNLFTQSRSPSNRSVGFSLRSFSLLFDGGSQRTDRIILKSCAYVSTTSSSHMD